MRLDSLSERVAENIATLLRSEEWELIKYRILNICGNQVQTQINNSLSKGEKDQAMKYLGQLEGLRIAIDATEHISGEIKGGKLAVDEVSNVIENKKRRV